MARAQGARSQLAVAFETVYGTAPASGFLKVPFASITLGTEQPLLDSELLGYGRDPLAPVKDASTSDGDVVVPIDAVAWGIWLKGAFGDPTTTGTAAPYSHEFASGSYSLPLMSIEKGMPEVPNYEMFSGVMVDKISWQMQRSGLLTATVSCIAQGEDDATASAAGTLTEVDVERFGHFNGAIQRNGVSLGNVVSGQITYANNLDPIATIRLDGKIDGADPANAQLSGQIVVRFADTALRDQAIDGEACELTFAYALGDHSFELVAHKVYLPRPKTEISGPSGVQVTFDWQAANDLSLGRMCTATLINDEETY
uniref:phage tail tube protein n=1 Tax=Paenirhodobacter enshiensis TaxID=1105367 RepID=UPI0035AF2CBE